MIETKRDSLRGTNPFLGVGFLFLLFLLFLRKINEKIFYQFKIKRYICKIKLELYENSRNKWYSLCFS